MNIEIQNRITKIRELINRGATMGEKIAAQKALERLVKKYNIDLSTLERTIKKEYHFKYKMDIEKQLFLTLKRFFGITGQAYLDSGKYELSLILGYGEWVELDCAYEFFRRDMVRKWRAHCTPLVKRCRTAKTKKNRIAELAPIFLSKYIIASNLYKDDDIETRDLSEKEKNIFSVVGNVEGGKFNKQIISNKLLS